MNTKLYNIEELRCGAFLKAGKTFDMIRYEDFMQQTTGFRFPHQHNYFMILIATNGEGSQFIDFESYEISARHIFLLYPGMIHEWGTDRDLKGYLIFFTEEFFLQRYHENILSKFCFFSSSILPPYVTISPESFPRIEQLAGFMLSVYEQNNTQNMKSALRSYLNLILIECEKYCINTNEQIQDTVRDKVLVQQRKLMQQFEQLVSQSYKTKHLVKEYAVDLRITPNYLNIVCKKLRGISAGTIIKERILLEIKRMLHQESLTISEIAFELNFNDNSYFCKFFKKHTGYTPKKFREVFRKK